MPQTRAREEGETIGDEDRLTCPALYEEQDALPTATGPSAGRQSLDVNHALMSRLRVIAKSLYIIAWCFSDIAFTLFSVACTSEDPKDPRTSATTTCKKDCPRGVRTAAILGSVISWD